MKSKIRSEARREIWARYTEKWRYAWAHRREMDRPPRTSEEAEFLPAALSVQDTPVSPLTSWGMRGIAAFAVLALIASIVFEIDIVVTAPGVILPTGNVKVVQALEPGVVKKILVKEAQKVKAGDILVELFTPGIETDSAKMQAEQLGMSRELNRLRSVVSLIDSSSADNIVSSYQKTQGGALLAEQLIEYENKRARAKAEIAGRRAELASAMESLEKVRRSIPRLELKVKDYKELEEDGFVSRHGLLDQIQMLEDAKSETAVQLARIQQARASLEQAEIVLRGITAEVKRGLLEQQRDYGFKLEAVEQDLAKYRHRDQLMVLRAPIDGVVTRLTIHTLGGVVQSAQALMTIVPEREILEIEASVGNKDVGHLKIGQSAQIKVETYPFTQYGFITAKLMHIAADGYFEGNTSEKSEGSNGAVYKSRLSLPDSDELGKTFPYPLRSGMAVTVEVNIGKRRVIEYFLSPFLSSAKEAIRER